ncbi:MAG: hypothetical protein ACTSQF_00160 [Candidatus Heimdallarchaeaceae archaeon]
MKKIELATAYANQQSPNGDRQDWKIFNTDNEELHSFPKEYTEKQIMAAVHFARKFELIAFNKGIEFQKEKAPKELVALQKIVKTFQNDRKKMIERNLELANELDNLNNQLDELTIKN